MPGLVKSQSERFQGKGGDNPVSAEEKRKEASIQSKSLYKDVQHIDIPYEKDQSIALKVGLLSNSQTKLFQQNADAEIKTAVGQLDSSRLQPFQHHQLTEGGNTLSEAEHELTSINSEGSDMPENRSKAPKNNHQKHTPLTPEETHQAEIHAARELEEQTANVKRQQEAVAQREQKEAAKKKAKEERVAVQRAQQKEARKKAAANRETERAKQEAERAKQEAERAEEEKAQQEAERAKQEAEERAKQEAERAKQKAVAQREQQEAEERAKQEAEKAQQEAANREAEAEEKAKQEAGKKAAILAEQTRVTEAGENNPHLCPSPLPRSLSSSSIPGSLASTPIIPIISSPDATYNSNHVGLGAGEVPTLSDLQERDMPSKGTKRKTAERKADAEEKAQQEAERAKQLPAPEEIITTHTQSQNTVQVIANSPSLSHNSDGKGPTQPLLQNSDNSTPNQSNPDSDSDRYYKVVDSYISVIPKISYVINRLFDAIPKSLRNQYHLSSLDPYYLIPESLRTKYIDPASSSLSFLQWTSTDTILTAARFMSAISAAYYHKDHNKLKPVALHTAAMLAKKSTVALLKHINKIDEVIMIPDGVIRAVDPILRYVIDRNLYGSANLNDAIAQTIMATPAEGNYQYCHLVMSAWVAYTQPDSGGITGVIDRYVMLVGSSPFAYSLFKQIKDGISHETNQRPILYLNNTNYTKTSTFFEDIDTPTKYQSTNNQRSWHSQDTNNTSLSSDPDFPICAANFVYHSNTSSVDEDHTSNSPYRSTTQITSSSSDHNTNSATKLSKEDAISQAIVTALKKQGADKIAAMISDVISDDLNQVIKNDNIISNIGRMMENHDKAYLKVLYGLHSAFYPINYMAHMNYMHYMNYNEIADDLIHTMTYIAKQCEESEDNTCNPKNIIENAVNNTLVNAPLHRYFSEHAEEISGWFGSKEITWSESEGITFE